MNRKRIGAGLLVIFLLAGASYMTLLSFGFVAATTEFQPVPAGHREIIFLAPATSGDAWDRLVAAVDALQQESTPAAPGKPKLNVSKERAFTALTADVPELSLWPDGCEDAKLWIRWCKLSAENKTETWIARLLERHAPPLAIIGGDTTRRAVRAAKALQSHRAQWQGAPPLLLITTATSDHYDDNPIVAATDEKLPKLIDIYGGQSFRFSFTDSRMTQAVLDFVHSHDHLWPRLPSPVEQARASAQACLTARDPLQAAALAATADDLSTNYLYTIRWDDDSYSVDLATRFAAAFQKTFPSPRISAHQIAYSAGDFYQPSPREAFVVGQLLPELKAARDRRQLMLLPADAERARRILRTVVRRSTPHDLRNLVVVTCDSLNFNTIYRDRNVTWNIQDMPLPLVMFCHCNPVAEEVGFKEQTSPGSTGTEDLLLYRDMLQALLLTAYTDSGLARPDNDLVSGLHTLAWVNGRVRIPVPGDGSILLFAPQTGNRNDGTGERIVVLQPDSDDHGPLAQAAITIWQQERGANLPRTWVKARTLTVTYDDLSP